MYKVIHYFTDLQDFNHPYDVGDTFPRPGVSVTEERLKELSGNNNKQKKPLIKCTENKVKQKTYTKTEINRMPASELKALAIENKIAEAEEKSGTELKKLLIEKFGL